MTESNREFLDLAPELKLKVFTYLDIPSVLRFAQCSSITESITQSSYLWERYYKTLWPEDSRDDLSHPESPTWFRSELFRRARVRLDGVYVSRCEYIRRIQEGASLTDPRRYMPIVYHRMIRFCPDRTAYMVLSEKGSKRSARTVFADLVQGSTEALVEKYGNQVHVCQWHVIASPDASTKMTVSLSFFDGHMSWSAKLRISGGSKTVQGGCRMTWLEYKFWNPAQVAGSRIRALYRQREALAGQLRVATLRGNNEVSPVIITELESISAEILNMRELTHEPVESVPEEHMQDIRLTSEHYPVARFVSSPKLAHLFLQRM